MYYICVCVCVCDRLQELKCDSVAACSGSGTPQVVSSSIRILAQALGHIEQGIERRFLKAPLGESGARAVEVLNRHDLVHAAAHKVSPGKLLAVQC